MKSCSFEAVKEVLGLEAKKKKKKYAIYVQSNNTLKARIELMSNDIERNNLYQKLKCLHSSLCSVMEDPLLTFLIVLCYSFLSVILDDDNMIKEKLSISQKLAKTSTGIAM